MLNLITYVTVILFRKKRIKEILFFCENKQIKQKLGLKLLFEQTLVWASQCVVPNQQCQHHLGVR